MALWTEKCLWTIKLTILFLFIFFSGFWQIPSHHTHAVTPFVHVLRLCVLPDSIPSLFLADKHTKQPLQQSSINSYMHTCVLLCFQKASSCIQAPDRISHSLHAHQPAPFSSTPRLPEHLWGRRVAFPVQVGNQESQGEQEAWLKRGRGQSVRIHLLSMGCSLGCFLQTLIVTTSCCKWHDEAQTLLCL